jgi:hypothetical protein
MRASGLRLAARWKSRPSNTSGNCVANGRPFPQGASPVRNSPIPDGPTFLRGARDGGAGQSARPGLLPTGHAEAAQHAGWHGIAEPVRLDDLTAAETVDLLARSPAGPGPGEMDGAGELCAELGCLPLSHRPGRRIPRAGPGHAAGVPAPAGGLSGADVPGRRRGQRRRARHRPDLARQAGPARGHAAGQWPAPGAGMVRPRADPFAVWSTGYARYERPWSRCRNPSEARSFQAVNAR